MKVTWHYHRPAALKVGVIQLGGAEGAVPVAEHQSIGDRGSDWGWGAGLLALPAAVLESYGRVHTGPEGLPILIR